MFKESLSALASSVSGAARQTVSEYKPTAANMGGAFTRVAQQGIANMSFRSPILADMAATMLHAFQMEMIKRDQIRKYTKTGDAEGLREKIKEELGSKAKDADVDKKMFEILNKMEKLVEVEGDKAKSNELFQKFEKEFDEFKKHFHPEEQDPQLPHGQPGALGAGGDASLGRIEVNTLHTVQALNELIDKGVGSGGGEGAPSGENASKAPNGSFVDPYTGLPSIRAAMGSIGGSFLAKVFDEDTIEKYANKTREKLFGKEEKKEEPKLEVKQEETATEVLKEKAAETANVKPSKDAMAEKFNQMLSGIDLDLNSPPSDTTESSREDSAKVEKIAQKHDSLQTQVIDELKTLNENTKAKKEDSEGGVGGVLKSLTGMLGKFGPILEMVGGIASKALPLLAVAAAGAAGYAAGTALNDHVINPLVQKATGDKEATLGTWLYDKFNDDPMKQMEENDKKAAALRANQKNTGSEVQKMTEEKNAAAAKSAQPTGGQTQVAAINTTNNNNNTTVVAVASPRNQESSFDRVQQSNFWGRTP